MWLKLSQDVFLIVPGLCFFSHKRWWWGVLGMCSAVPVTDCSLTLCVAAGVKWISAL